MSASEGVAVSGPEGAPKGGGNQVLPWSGLRDAKPKRGEEKGVVGDRAPSDLVFVKCRGRKIEGAERANS